MFSPLLEELITALRCLPGVGPKSAQRIALHLLERNRDGGLHLATSLQEAIAKVGHCQQCRIFSETDICQLCGDSSRQQELLCIVETPADLLAIEQAGVYRGLYFVLMGHLSPIDGIGPQEIGLDLLERRLQAGEIQELILATGTTVEGEATAHYISELAASLNVATSRIAHGVPLGGELEYVDSNTLGLAFAGRKTVE